MHIKTRTRLSADHVGMRNLEATHRALFPPPLAPTVRSVGLRWTRKPGKPVGAEEIERMGCGHNALKHLLGLLLVSLQYALAATYDELNDQV